MSTTQLVIEEIKILNNVFIADLNLQLNRNIKILNNAIQDYKQKIKENGKDTKEKIER